MTNEWQTTVDEKKSDFHVDSDVVCIKDEEVYCVDGATKSVVKFQTCEDRQLQVQ